MSPNPVFPATPRKEGCATSRRRPGARALLATGVGLAAASALLAPVLGDDVALAAPAPALALDASATATPTAAPDLASRAAAADQTSRSAARGALPVALAAGDAQLGDPAATSVEEPAAEPTPEAAGKRYATAGVNVRSEPSTDGDVLDTLDRGAKVTITDTKQDGWQQVLVDDEAAWVRASYLAKSKPAAAPKGLSSAACASGSGVESGLRSNTIAVHRAVCAAFPQVTSYGGIRGGSANHGSGRALDIMIPNSATGDAIAAYVRANAARLGVTEVIWKQRIWTTQRASEGWRGMPDRGSATANHYDHVHVTVR